MAVVIGVAIVARQRSHPRTKPNPISIAYPASRPVITTSSQQPAPSPPAAWIDLLRFDHPDLATTQLLKVPLDLESSAHWIISEPVYLSGPPNTHLWITRLDARPTNVVLKEAVDVDAEVEAHLLPEQVVFVHWMPVEGGIWPPYLVCRGPSGRFELAWSNGRASLPAKRDYLWDHAFSWDKRIVVPTRTGISIFSIEPQLTESYQELSPATATRPVGPATNPTQPADKSAPMASADRVIPEALVEAEDKSLLAWIAAGRGRPGSRGACRFAEGKWSRLGPEEGWPANIVHLVPLLDGSVLQIGLSDSGETTLGLTSVGKPIVDEHQISQLVDSLSDTDQTKRDSATYRTTDAIWPWHLANS